MPKRRSITKKESLMLGPLFKKIAPRLGAEVTIEPKWGIVGQIKFADGRKTYFRYNTVDLNPVGASDIAKDKDFANFFMQDMDYPIVPNSQAFYSPRWAKAIGSRQSINAAYHHAVKIGFPAVLKPNSGSQGDGVTVVHNKTEFYQVANAIFRQDRIMLVQSKLTGKDYRIVVLDDEVISAYQRLPLSVLGDGKSTIKQLLCQKQKEFVATQRDTRIKFNDPRILSKLKRQKLSFRSVLKKGEQVFLLDNANLSSGGESIDVTDSIARGYCQLAVSLTKDMGLRLCGVDIMIGGSGDISDFHDDFWILEINAAPGLDHYSRSGEEQSKVVEQLYTKVLIQLQKRL